MAFGTAFTYLTSGVFLSGLAILIGADDVLVSYISVIANICGVLILAFAAFLERFRSRKRLTIGLTILSKLSTLFIVTIPAFVPAEIRVAAFIPAVVVAFLVASVANAGFVVSVFNRRYELMPESSRIVYDNFYSAAIGIGFIFGPVTGGVIRNYLTSRDAMAKSVPVANFRLLYVISTVGILLLQTLYSRSQRKRAQSQCIPCEGGICCVKN